MTDVALQQVSEPSALMLAGRDGHSRRTPADDLRQMEDSVQ